MCGIFGILNFDGAPVESSALCATAKLSVLGKKALVLPLMAAANTLADYRGS